MKCRTIGFTVLFLALGSRLSAQATTVVLVRHAEKVSPTGDPDLSPAGRLRAAALARTLERFDLSAIFVTQYKRTHQTADSTAALHHLVPREVGTGRDLAAHAAAVATAIRQSPAGSAVLVVGHSNTLGPIIAALGGPRLPDLCDGEYSTLLVLELPPGAAPRLLRASYGAGDPVIEADCGQR